MRSDTHPLRRGHRALRRTLAAGVIAVVAVLASTLPAAAVHDGRPASTDWQPFVVALTDDVGSQFCGGTLVTPTKVVTAGHCVANRAAAGLRVVGGRTDLRTSEGEVRRVTDVWLHPRYDFLTYDAAVLTLARPLPYRTLPLAGPSEDALYAKGRTATVLGWGRTTPDSGPSPVLRRAALVLAPLPACDPYTVEGDNADLRHYLAQLGRKSRCFSRCIEALRRAMKLFVWCYNHRQLWQQRYPQYSRPIIDFISP